MKGLLAFENVVREAGTPYFSSLYDIDDWHRDLAIIKDELQYAEAVNEHIFEFYYEGLKGYAGAREVKEEMFYMGLLKVLTALYHKINNVSEEEAKQILADLATKRIEEKRRN